MKNIGNSASSGVGGQAAQMARTKSLSGSCSSAASSATSKPAARAASSSVVDAAPVSSWLQRSRSARHTRPACAVWRTTTTVCTRGGEFTSASASAVRTDRGLRRIEPARAAELRQRAADAAHRRRRARP